MKKKLIIAGILSLLIFASFQGLVFAKEDSVIDFMKYLLQKIESLHKKPAPADPVNINIIIEAPAPIESKPAEPKEVQPKDTNNTEEEASEAKGLKVVADIKKTSQTKEVPKPEKKVAPNPLKGIYLTAETIRDKRGLQLVDELLKSGGNAVVIDIEHGGGKLAFTPKNEFLKSLNPGSETLNDLPQTIEELHKKGVYVIARQVVFNDPYMSSRKPEWRIKNKWGGLYDYRWLDPSIPGVHLYNIYVMQEVAEMGFDEIQFDYIRFPAAAHQYLDYNYNEEEFTRVDVINEFLNKAKQVADSYGIQLSVDVFGAIVWGDVDWKIVGQNPAEMAKYVDAIYPMTYPSHVSPGYYGHMNPYGDPYSFVNNSISRFVEAVDGNAEIRTWVQGFPLRIPSFGTWFMEDQIKATFDAGGTGYTIWSPGNHYTYSWPAFKLEPKKEELVSEKTEVIISGQ